MAQTEINRIETLEAPPQAGRQQLHINVGGIKQPLQNILVATWLNWEAVAWIAIVILAFVTRLADLAPRALHQDEATHAGTFTREMYLGRSIYQYDPTFHGPFLYYAVSLSYFLFGGPSDTTARVAPALFGISTVLLCWYLRPIIGKFGAFFAALLTLISPSILYYNRNLRHDSFALFGQLLMVVGLFRFFQEKPGRKLWWMSLSGLGLAITYTSHELVFLNTGILVFWLVVAFAIELIALPPAIKNLVGIRRKESKIEPIEAVTEVESVDIATETTLLESTIDETLPLSDENFPEDLTQHSETAPQPPTPNPRNIVQKIMTNASLMGAILFVVLAGQLLWGATNLFRKTTETGDIPKLFSGNVPSWLILIPFGLIFCLIISYMSGKAVAAGWRGLEKFPAIVTAAISLLVLVGLGGLQYVRSQNNAPKLGDPTSGTIAASTVEPIKDTNLTVLGLQLPGIAVQLTIVLLLALFVGLLVGWVWQRRFLIYNRKGLFGFVITFFVVFGIASLVSLRFMRFALTPAEVSKYQTGLPRGNLLLFGPEVDKWQAYMLNGVIFGIILGLVAGWLVSLAEVLPDEKLAGSATLRGILRIFRQPKALTGFLVAFGILYALLFGNFFFYAQGLADGVYRGLEYWVAVHDTRRIDQPWFYYPLLMLLYEPLPTLLTLVALIAFPVGWVRRAVGKGKFVFTLRGLMAGYCAFWSVLAMIAYSVAGEKVPWLNIQVALPAILTAGIVADNVFRRINWRDLYKPSQGLLFGGLFGIMFIATTIFIMLALSKPAPQNQLVQMILAGIIVVGLFAATVWMWRIHLLSGRLMRATILTLVSLVLLAYGFKATLMLNFNNGDINIEPMIQVQTTPELLLFVERVSKLSRDYRNDQTPATDTPKVVADPTGGRNLPVLLSQNVAPPLTWYFRDYTDINYFTPNNDSSQNTEAAPAKDARGNQYAIIAMDRSEDQFKIQDQLKDGYTRQLYRRYWWFPEDDSGYLGITKTPTNSADPNRDRKNILNTDWKKLWETFTVQPSAEKMWRYILFREVSQPLQSYDMVVYVRNDLMPDFGLLSGTNTGTKATPGTNGFKLTDSTQPGIKNGEYKTPRAIAFTPNGDILVLDSGNGRVQRFSADGIFLSTFGKIGAADGQFQIIPFDGGAGGIAVDEDGNIYVTDSWNYRIQKFDATGKFLTKWGRGFDTKGDPAVSQANPNGLYGPRGLAYDKTKGELYVADTGNRRVLVFDKSGNFLRQFGSAGSGPAQFNEPVSVAVSPQGKVYVTDSRNKRVQIFDRDGNYQSEIAVPNWVDQPLSEPYVALDLQGNIFVSDSANGRVYKFSPEGGLLQTFESQSGTVLVNPIGLAVGPGGFLYVADAKQHSIIKIKG